MEGVSLFKNKNNAAIKTPPKVGVFLTKSHQGEWRGVFNLTVLRGYRLWHNLIDLLGVGRWLGLAFQKVAGLG